MVVTKTNKTRVVRQYLCIIFFFLLLLLQFWGGNSRLDGDHARLDDSLQVQLVVEVQQGSVEQKRRWGTFVCEIECVCEHAGEWGQHWRTGCEVSFVYYSLLLFSCFLLWTTKLLRIPIRFLCPSFTHFFKIFLFIFILYVTESLPAGCTLSKRASSNSSTRNSVISPCSSGTP